MILKVLIPCHNDCKKAEFQQKRLKNYDVEIVHNGCNNQGGYTFSNKARGINEEVKYIYSDYIICLDADVVLSPYCIKSLIEECKKGIDYVSATSIYKRKDKEIQRHYYGGFNGACFAIKTSLLKKYKIPENIVTEDTAYFEILKSIKPKLKIKTAVDAIMYVDWEEENYSKKLRQLVRYDLGSYQLFSIKGGFKYGLAPLIKILLSMCVIYVLFTSLDSVKILIILNCWLIWFLVSMKNKINDALVDLYNLFISPIYALYLFITKQRIW